jgi:hypothetical protein
VSTVSSGCTCSEGTGTITKPGDNKRGRGSKELGVGGERQHVKEVVTRMENDKERGRQRRFSDREMEEINARWENDNA